VDFLIVGGGPKPVFGRGHLKGIVVQAVLMLLVAHPDIVFSYDQAAASPVLIADRRQLGQAITNILKNAAESIEERIKTDNKPGEISVSLREADGRIYVEVCDNGIGLPEDRDRIMEPYITNRATGSGLGLAIVKKIVEEHFGEIVLADAPGGGAIVTVIFTPDLVAEKVGGVLASKAETTQEKDDS